MGRVLAACLCGVLLSVPATSVWALDKAQIIQMKKFGMDDKAIKGAIDTAGDELMLDDKAVEELKKSGISQEVIDHLRRTGHLKTKAADTAPGPGPGPGDPAPAPGDPAPEPNSDETEEERNARLAKQAEMEAEIKRKAEAMLKEQEEAKQRTAALASEARRIPEALRNVAEGKNMEAARACLRFLSLNPPEVSAEWYDAKFCLAKALYQEGILSGASRPLVEVLLKGAGANRPHFKESFGMLKVLATKIGYKPPLLAELTTVNLQSLNESFRDDFNYFMGKFFYDYNDMAKAREHLSKVKGAATDYPEARYLMGVAQLGAVQNDEQLRTQAPEAVRNFQEAIVAAEAKTGGNEDILQLGYLALARVYYEVGLYDVAMFYYRKLPTESSRNAEAMFEIAWTYFLKNDYKRALGTFQLLNSPYYKKWFYPDIGILEATIYLNLCKFEQSKLSLAKLQKDYLDRRPALQAFTKQLVEKGPEWGWNAMVTYYNGGGEKTLGLPRMFADAVLDDLAFFNNYKVVQVLQKERDALKANIGSLGELGQEVLKRVEEQLRIKINEGGLVVQQRLAAIDGELQRLDLQATQISFDLDKEEKEQIQERIQSGDKTKERADAGTTLFVVADDWHPWPFEGEYWLDEVGNYRSNLRTECVEQ